MLVRRARLHAELTSEIRFKNGLTLDVYERIQWDEGTLSIVSYSYEVLRGAAKLYWYDSQPHPGDRLLAVTHPHHKHVPPDIKHNRVPAPGMSFKVPNLEFLIEEINMTE